MSQVVDRSKISRRERFRKIRKSHRGTLGIAEIIGLGLAALMLLAVVVAYLYFLVPAQLRVTARTREREQLQQQQHDADVQFQRDVDLKVRVARIVGSLADFENKGLDDRDGGRMALYEDLNQLIHKNSLRNTSGPAYTSLEPLAVKPQGQAAAASTSSANKWQSIYPGIGVNVTVEGSYQSVRHFVRDIESSKEFTIVNAVELERATGSNAQPVPESGPKSGSSNALVSLRLELATYFSRPDQLGEKAAAPAAAVH
jgi:Tfp pilus assembly protein PilO